MLIKNYNKLIKNVDNFELKKKRKDILDILLAAIEAVDPYKIIKNNINGNNLIFDDKIINTENFNNIYLVGFGKASIEMGRAIFDSFDIKKGILVTNKNKKNFINNNIEIFEAGHPIPNQSSINGTNKILDLINNCKANDLLIVLISGGGSSLLCSPRIPLEDLQLTTNFLLRTNMTINEINTIRKHLSFVKGGQLIKDARCSIVSLIISDIIKDPIEFIASGPTYPDSTTYEDAKNILLNYNLWNVIPNSTKNIIEKGINGLIPETLNEDNTDFNKLNNFIIANNRVACLGAEKKAREIGYKSKIISTSIQGEARYVGKKLIRDFVKEYKRDNRTNLLIAGGETTVKVSGSGLGGRNQEMVLGVVEYIKNKNIVFTSFATDGIDGNSKAAGALADSTTYTRAIEKNCNPNTYLKDNNSNEFFKNIGDLILTGSTGTNVMDIQIIIK